MVTLLIKLKKVVSAEGHDHEEVITYETAIMVKLTQTNTHNHFMALLDFVWDYPDEPSLER